LYHLREARAAYNSDFTPEKDGLRAVDSNNKCNVILANDHNQDLLTLKSLFVVSLIHPF